jgi:hypothetical protein
MFLFSLLLYLPFGYLLLCDLLSFKISLSPSFLLVSFFTSTTDSFLASISALSSNSSSSSSS